MKPLNLGVFASGRGSNFKAIMAAIDENRLDAKVRLLISNNPEAGAAAFAGSRSVPVLIANRQDSTSREVFIRRLLDGLAGHRVDFIALAGYMKMIPPEVISAFKNRIVNIHPALLPLFGGKGMYGARVHEAVLASGCKVTGVTVHLVDEVYDRGPIVVQRCVPVKESDSPDSLARRVLETEHRLYAEALQLFAEERVEVKGSRVRIL